MIHEEVSLKNAKKMNIIKEQLLKELHQVSFLNHNINVTEYLSNFYLGKYDNFTYQCTDLRQQEFQGKLKRLGVIHK